MAVAIVLQARMGSVRLPGKVLADLCGRPILEHCIERLRARSDLPVVLATTTRPEDDCLELYAATLGVAVVRGPDQDVLGRFVKAVSALSLTEVIRATADNPAVDMDAPARTLELLRRTGADHVVERGLPYGAAVEAVTADALLRAADEARDLSDREHVTPLIRRDGRFRALQAIAPGSVREPGLRVTVDTTDDLEFMRRLMKAAGAEGAGLPIPLATLITVARTLPAEAHGGSGPVRQGAK